MKVTKAAERLMVVTLVLVLMLAPATLRAVKAQGARTVMLTFQLTLFAEVPVDEGFAVRWIEPGTTAGEGQHCVGPHCWDHDATVRRRRHSVREEH